MENPFFIYKIIILCMTKLQYVRVDCMFYKCKGIVVVGSMHAEASADPKITIHHAIHMMLVSCLLNSI